MKYINEQYYFIREKLESGVIELQYCPTKHIVADVLTKALGRDRHQTLVMTFELKGFGYAETESVEVDDV